GVDIVARESSLPALVELAFGRECERVRGDDHQNRPSATSKCVGLSRLSPPASIHAATISMSSREVTAGGPISAWHAEASLSSATLPSAPPKRHGLPNRAAKNSAGSRT